VKVFLEMTGCRLNQSEIDTLARQFQQAGHTVVTTVEEADLCVVNTCAVTQDATRTSRQLIRHINRDNPTAQIVATGCYAHLSPKAVEALPGVSHVIDNIQKDRLVSLVTGSEVPLETFDLEPISRDTALGRTRSFVKVQDGCNNRCSFCVTTLARGAGRSRPAEQVLREVQALAAVGYQEIVLTGVHLGSYGHDQGKRAGLMELIRLILDQTEIPRLRLSSLEPWDLASEFFSLWENPRVCRHLHLPLQSGCDATLRRMARRTSQMAFRALVEAARTQIPDLALSTDLIVGFPGETDEEFESSYQFTREMDFMKLHVFRYSPRTGTAAARMPHQVPDPIKKERSARLFALSEENAARFAARFVGRKMDVLWEHIAGASEAGFQNTGLTDNYIRVDAEAPVVLTNTISTAQVVGVTKRGLVAEIGR
jgi:threonylcarbamoyladenosine tRNA methylthiotransferase MtaB